MQFFRSTHPMTTTLKKMMWQRSVFTDKRVITTYVRTASIFFQSHLYIPCSMLYLTRCCCCCFIFYFLFLLTGNIWIKAINKYLSKYLFSMLKESLSNVEDILRVTTCYEQILITMDKLFSLCCNYPKGSGQRFARFMSTNHPGAVLLAVLWRP